MTLLACGKAVAGVEASLGLAGQIVHVPGVALHQPVAQECLTVQPVEPGKSALGKAQGGRLGPNLVFQTHAPV